MNIITIDAQVSQDRQLIYTLPPEVPVGPVKLMIQVEQNVSISEQSLTRDEAHRRLLAAGKLVTEPSAPVDAVPLSDEERSRLAILFGGGSVTTLDIINQERGPK